MINSLWIELHQEMPRHPKTLALARALKISRREAVGLLADLWTWALNCADEHGDLRNITDEALSLALDWPEKRAGALAGALRSVGWLDGESGGYRIHDWEDYTSRLSEKRKDAQRKRDARKRKKAMDTGSECPEDVRGQSPDVPRTKPVNPRAYITEPNLTKPNQDKRSCLVPPTPQGEDGTDETDLDPEEVLDELKDRVEYEVLTERFPPDQVDELLAIMADAVCSHARYGTIGGEKMPRRLIRGRMMSLEYEHLVYVLENRGKSHAEIKNIKAYLRAMLYNAPACCANAEAAKFEHTQGEKP